MRKKIMLASAVSCLLVSAAHAAIDTKPEGLYLKGSWENMISTKTYHNLSTPGLAFGYKKDFLRAEVQIAYARIHQRLCGFSACEKVKTNHNFNVGVHGFLDWDNSTMFSPYVGLGLEKSNWTNRDRLYSSGYSPSYDRLHLVGLVGTRAYFTKNVALDVGYKTNINNIHNGGGGSLGLVWSFD